MQGGVRVEALVKAGMDLRFGSLNQIETNYLHRPSPWPRQALEKFCQATQGQRFPADLQEQTFKTY